MKKTPAPPGLLQRLLLWLDRLLFGAPSGGATKLDAGHQAEELAARYLRAKGYEIIGRNVRVGRGELDVIAKVGETVVVVEVKSGQVADGFLPREKVNRVKQHQLSKLTEQYRKQQRLLGQGIRIDIVEVVLEATGKPRIEHFEGAVREMRSGRG